MTTQCSKKTPLPPSTEEIMNTNTKYWSFTWDTNKKQKKLPSEEILLDFFDSVADECVFQYEKGRLRGREHVQGTFTLAGPRQSKIGVLRQFEKLFKNTAGLTLSPVYDKIAIKSYVTKSEGRTRGPFYGGKKEVYDKKMSAAKLRTWQKLLFEFLTGPEKATLKDRKVIWVEDEHGNTGKSWFQKWLRIGQKKLTARTLPISSVDRLISAVHHVTKARSVDMFMIDFTRTQGENQSFKDLFETIEHIKNGYVVDVMYGNYNESIFDPPMVIIFTNKKIDEFRNYLSNDRWKIFIINRYGDIAEQVDQSTCIRLEDQIRLLKSKRKNNDPEKTNSPD